MLFSVSNYVTKWGTRTTTKCTAKNQVPEIQPDVEWERTKLLGYSQKLAEVEKNKKKSIPHAHLDISLLKLRGDEIKGFHLPSMLSQNGNAIYVWPDYAKMKNFSKIFFIFF